MTIQIGMSGHDADDELRSLYAWLQDEPGVRHNAQISLVSGFGASDSAQSEGQMGSTLDVIQFVVNDGFQALSLALAYVTWRGTRVKRPPVTIEHGGTKVTLDDADPDSVQRIVNILGRG
jgi:hypothetical protein